MGVKKIEYILYKNPIQNDTLAIVQYCKSIGIDILPTLVVERNYPHSITNLPAIATRSGVYQGLDKCISFYEKITQIDDILQKAEQWKIMNLKYHTNCAE